jgi:hypothetical protein
LDAINNSKSNSKSETEFGNKLVRSTGKSTICGAYIDRKWMGVGSDERRSKPKGKDGEGDPSETAPGDFRVANAAWGEVDRERFGRRI